MYCCLRCQEQLRMSMYIIGDEDDNNNVHADVVSRRK